MKNVFKVFGIIALAAIVGFSMTACGGGGDGGDGGGGGTAFATFSGTWKNDADATDILTIAANGTWTRTKGDDTEGTLSSSSPGSTKVYFEDDDGYNVGWAQIVNGKLLLTLVRDTNDHTFTKQSGSSNPPNPPPPTGGTGSGNLVTVTVTNIPAGVTGKVQVLLSFGSNGWEDSNWEFGAAGTGGVTIVNGTATNTFDYSDLLPVAFERSQKVRLVLVGSPSKSATTTAPYSVASRQITVNYATDFTGSLE